MAIYLQIVLILLLILSYNLPSWDTDISVKHIQEGLPVYQWFRIYLLLFRHTFRQHFAANLIAFIIQTYFMHTFMDNNQFWLFLIFIISPIHSYITGFAWKYNPLVYCSYGFSVINFAVMGALLGVLIVQWKNLSKSAKIQLFIVSILGLCMGFFQLFGNMGSHTMHFGAYISGFFLIIGFYKNKFKSMVEIFRLITSILVMVLHLVFAILFIIYNPRYKLEMYQCPNGTSQNIQKLQ